MRLIDADALTDELIKGIEADTDKSIQTSFTKSVCMILCKAIEQQPTIDAEPIRHGKWIEYPAADGMNQCSVCGVLRFGDSNYCPNCGADMRGKSDE